MTLQISLQEQVSYVIAIAKEFIPWITSDWLEVVLFLHITPTTDASAS